jgi:hypothetical protein
MAKEIDVSALQAREAIYDHAICLRPEAGPYPVSLLFTRSSLHFLALQQFNSVHQASLDQSSAYRHRYGLRGPAPYSQLYPSYRADLQLRLRKGALAVRHTCCITPPLPVIFSGVTLGVRLVGDVQTTPLWSSTV